MEAEKEAGFGGARTWVIAVGGRREAGKGAGCPPGLKQAKDCTTCSGQQPEEKPPAAEATKEKARPSIGITKEDAETSGERRFLRGGERTDRRNSGRLTLLWESQEKREGGTESDSWSK